MNGIVWTRLHTAFMVVVSIAMIGMTVTTVKANTKRALQATAPISDWKCHPIHPGQSACYNLVDGGHMIVATGLR